MNLMENPPVPDRQVDCTQRTAHWISKMTSDGVPAHRGPQDSDSVGDSICVQFDAEEHQDIHSADNEVAAHPEVDDDNGSKVCSKPVEEKSQPIYK